MSRTRSKYSSLFTEPYTLSSHSPALGRWFRASTATSSPLPWHMPLRKENRVTGEGRRSGRSNNCIPISRTSSLRAFRPAFRCISRVKADGYCTKSSPIKAARLILRRRTLMSCRFFWGRLPVSTLCIARQLVHSPGTGLWQIFPEKCCSNPLGQMKLKSCAV